MSDNPMSATERRLQDALSEAARALGRDRGRRNESIAQRITAILKQRDDALNAKPRVVIVDMRSGGGIKADGSNIDLPPEGQESALRSIETADVYVQVHADGIYVKEGSEKGWVLLITTKGEAKMSAEKAERDLSRRERGPEVPTGMTGDRPTFDDDPVDQKFARVWEESGPTRTERLKGY